MPEPQADDAQPQISLKKRTLLLYEQALDIIVSVLIIVMLLALLGALIGLMADFWTAVINLRDAMSASQTLAQGLIDNFGKSLVIDVLSVFVLIELFRTFTDYLEFHRVRLRVLTEVGIAFILREIFIGLYGHSIEPIGILSLSLLLGVLVAARIAAVAFHPKSKPESDVDIS
ncbi:MAG: phosphate-starvation-inducible PsiE family protein [Gallionellaceae bacterium]|jgi:uncharacterized membrane protein (DUF373 family)|nr:phosphate-starvation-inducible PsiE family protein [Gallionellaceae bacterium]